MKEKRKPKFNIWQNVSFMVRTAWRVRKSVIFSCLGIAALGVVLDLLRLYVAKGILSKIENAAPVGELVATVAFFFLSISVLAGVQRYLTLDSKTIDTKSSQIDVRRHIRGMINGKAGTTSFPNTRDPHAQSLLAAALDTTDGFWSASEAIWFRLRELLYSTACFAVYLWLLTDLNIFLVLVSSATTLGGFLLKRRLDAWIYEHSAEEAKYLKQIAYAKSTATSVTAAKDIRIFGLKPWLDEIYDGAMRLYRDYLNRRGWIFVLGEALNVLMLLLRNGIAYGYLIYTALVNGLPASEFLLYFKAISSFTERLSGIMEQLSLLRRENVYLSVIQEYLNLPEPFRFEGGRPVPKAEQYELKLDHVTFRYPGTETDLFSDLELTVRPGEKLAVVGLNGAGKTTLVSLLCGFYDPDAGAVRLNGIDIREFNRREYYDLFCAVFQDSAIMNATVAENIAVDPENIDIQRVEECLARAGLENKIRTMPKGLQTHLGREVYLDGILLSGGLTQRLLLARALYKNAPILVLDEPTAALDPLAENDIYMKYNEMTRGKTSLFISHRLASTRFCDRIILVDHGRILEQGTHEQLLAQGGKYTELFEIQSRYYQEGRDFRD